MLRLAGPKPVVVFLPLLSELCEFDLLKLFFEFDRLMLLLL